MCFCSGYQRNQAITKRRRVNRFLRSTQPRDSMRKACWSPSRTCSPTSEFCFGLRNCLQLKSQRLWVRRSFSMPCSSSLFRFKNVIFEISPSEAVGVFDVKAKFMGVHLETLQIEYQVVFLSLFEATSLNHAMFIEQLLITHNSHISQIFLNWAASLCPVNRSLWVQVSST